MKTFEISKKGLFLFEQNWTQSEKIARIFPFGVANGESDFLTIAKSALEQKHDFVFTVNSGIARDFPSGLVARIKLNAEKSISGKLLLDWKEHFESEHQNYSQGYHYYGSPFGEFGTFSAGSLSEYEIDFQKFGEKLSKVFRITEFCDFVAGFFTPLAEESKSKKLKVSCLAISRDLYELKRTEKFLRSREHETEGYFFQDEELLPILSKISRLEIEHLGTAPHRSATVTQTK